MERFLNYAQMTSVPVHLEFTDEAHITDIHNVRTGIFAREATEELMVLRNNGYRLSFAAGVYYSPPVTLPYARILSRANYT